MWLAILDLRNHHQILVVSWATHDLRNHHQILVVSWATHDLQILHFHRDRFHLVGSLSDYLVHPHSQQHHHRLMKKVAEFLFRVVVSWRLA